MTSMFQFDQRNHRKIKIASSCGLNRAAAFGMCVSFSASIRRHRVTYLMSLTLLICFSLLFVASWSAATAAAAAP